MPDRTAWGIVGTGAMAARVADAVRVSGSGEVVAVLSRSARRGMAFAQAHGIGEARTSLDALLAVPGIDIVYIGSPNALHAREARQCIRAGRHVLCDKPLALNVGEAAEVRAAAETAGVRLGVVFQNRWHPTAARIRDLLGAGRIGQIQLVRASLGFGTEELVGWRSRRSLAGAGAIHNLGVHAYDTVRYLMRAEVASAAALVEPADRGALDRTVLALLLLESGVPAYVQVSQQLSQQDVRIEILGSAGTIEWNGWMAPYRSGELIVRSGGAEEREPSACPDAYLRLVRGFADSVEGRTRPVPSADDAVESVRIVDAILRSAHDGRTIAIER